MNMIYAERAQVHSNRYASWRSWFVTALTVASLGVVSVMELTKILCADDAFCPGGSGCGFADGEDLWTDRVNTDSNVSVIDNDRIVSNLTFDGVSILTATVNAGNHINVNNIDSLSNVYVVGSSSIENGNATDGTASLVKESEWVVTRIPDLGLVTK